MSKPVLWFKGSRGLNNRVDPLRVEFDPDTGIQDLSVAYNVVHDYTGRITRRKGWQTTAVISSAHSLFGTGVITLFVTEDALALLGPDFTYVPLRNVTVGARMSYALVGPRIYYANGHEAGMVLDGASYSWNLPSDVELTVPDTLKEYSQPPIGYLLAYFNGRMYIVQGMTIWYSEPYGVHLYDLARNYVMLDSEVQMLRPVMSGMFMSTETDTYFLRGTNPREFIFEKIATYPAIRGTDVEVDTSKIGEGQIRGVGVMWTSPEGICLGTADGQFFNLTERRLTYPNSLQGAGLYLGDRYIVTLEP